EPRYVDLVPGSVRRWPRLSGWSMLPTHSSGKWGPCRRGSAPTAAPGALCVLGRRPGPGISPGAGSQGYRVCGKGCRGRAGDQKVSRWRMQAGLSQSRGQGIPSRTGVLLPTAAFSSRSGRGSKQNGLREEGLGQVGGAPPCVTATVRAFLQVIAVGTSGEKRGRTAVSSCGAAPDWHPGGTGPVQRRHLQRAGQPSTEACAWNPSYSEGQGRRTAGVQGFKANLGNRARPCLLKNDDDDEHRGRGTVLGARVPGRSRDQPLTSVF
uniref:Uncharacterized protein n=1 Tax=Rhinopithecus roxellana TaxID=61622 RepID=A0A2K6QPK8_RHIRO